MIPEIGHLALIVFLILSLLGVAKGFFKQTLLQFIAFKRLVQVQFVLILISVATIVYSALVDDFSVAYLAEHSSSKLPFFYKATMFWGGHEGSILLWLLVLSGWHLWFQKHAIVKTLPSAQSILCYFQSGLALFILATSNPFLRLLPSPPLEGGDLNPLLQDFAFVIHPPMLYLGYVGLSIPFALILGALLSNVELRSVTTLLRKSTLLAWGFLTLGIMLGSWWAYYELGWGGWWFWDPVENASLIPWIAASALIHVIIAYEKRELFKSMVVFLSVLAFSMSLLGTFLVRSGVLSSVHAFASDPTRGVYMLAFIALTIGGAYTVFALKLKGESKTLPLVSREVALLLQALLMLVALACVLLGTLYPLFVDALTGQKLSVGPPYFNAILVPLFLVLLGMLSFGPYLKWGGQRLAFSLKAVIAPILIVLFTVACLVLGFGIMASVASALSVVFLIKFMFHLAKTPMSRWLNPMNVAHLGVLIFTLGVIGTSHFSQERELSLSINESVAIGPYTFKVEAFSDIKGPNYEGVQSAVKVFKNGSFKTTLYPEKRFYTLRNLALSETAIKAGLIDDLYIGLGEPLEKGWSFRIYVKTMVRWIWGGGLMVACAALYSGLRLQVAREPRVAPKLTPHTAAAKESIV